MHRCECVGGGCAPGIVLCGWRCPLTLISIWVRVSLALDSVGEGDIWHYTVCMCVCGVGEVGCPLKLLCLFAEGHMAVWMVKGVPSGIVLAV